MSRILVPVEILEGETIDPGLISFLAGDDVVLLGYHQIPEQTAAEQARESFGERAQAKLEDIASALEAAGATVSDRMVFTHDVEQTLTRVAAETDCDASIRLGSAMAMDRILVVLHPDAAGDDIARFAADHAVETDRELVLLSLTADESVARDSVESAQAVLDNAGVVAERIQVETAVTDAPLDVIVDAAVDADLVVIGERAPSAMDILLGDFVERIATETVGPVAVVRTAVEE